MFYILLFNLIISIIWCQDIERVVIPQGEPFAFDCQQDELVFFGRQLNQWTEIQENNEIYLYFNLKFNYITKDNILRVSSDSAESKHAGFYACRKSTWSSTSMNTIYQLILADVQSFYWTYICHGPIGSCERWNDLIDENLSRFEVADQTSIELFCCASVTGYKNVHINMNQIGNNYVNIDIKKKQELDGSLVICANQYTKLTRRYDSKQQILTCELLTDNRHHSTLSSVIIIKDAIQPDLSAEYNLPLQEVRDDDYLNIPVARRSRRRLTTGKKIAIIIGSIIAGLILLGLISFFIIYLCRHKKASSSSTMKITKPYLPVQTSERPRYVNESNRDDVEPVYEEPTPLSENMPVFRRC